MSDALAAAARPVPTLSPWSRRCWAAIALVAIADWLFYGHAVGANAALFLLTLWGGAVAANPCHLRRPQLLVALGIVLIVARIVLDRSNAWLVAANLISLAAMLYVCSLINFPRVIADYNVAHSRWIAGTGAPMDLSYLFDLGPQAIPAIDRYIASFSSRGQRDLAPARDDLARAQFNRMRDWRAWTYDDWRLLRYLDLTPPSLDSAGGPS